MGPYDVLLLRCCCAYIGAICAATCLILRLP